MWPHASLRNTKGTNTIRAHVDKAAVAYVLSSGACSITAQVAPQYLSGILHELFELGKLDILQIHSESYKPVNPTSIPTFCSSMALSSGFRRASYCARSCLCSSSRCRICSFSSARVGLRSVPEVIPTVTVSTVGSVLESSKTRISLKTARSGVLRDWPANY